MRKGRVVKPRLMLTLEETEIKALKVRAIEEGTTVSKLVRGWLRSWSPERRPRPGGRR